MRAHAERFVVEVSAIPRWVMMAWYACMSLIGFVGGADWLGFAGFTALLYLVTRTGHTVLDNERRMRNDARR